MTTSNFPHTTKENVQEKLEDLQYLSVNSTV